MHVNFNNVLTAKICLPCAGAENITVTLWNWSALTDFDFCDNFCISIYLSYRSEMFSWKNIRAEQHTFIILILCYMTRYCLTFCTSLHLSQYSLCFLSLLGAGQHQLPGRYCFSQWSSSYYYSKEILLPMHNQWKKLHRNVRHHARFTQFQGHVPPFLDTHTHTHTHTHTQ